MEAEVRKVSTKHLTEEQNGCSPDFLSFPELSSEKIGGKIQYATSEIANSVGNLLKTAKPQWKESRIRNLDQQPMDGWQAFDIGEPNWCIVQLGVPGILHGVEIDTSYFIANHARRISFEGAALESGQISPNTKWEELVPSSSLEPGYLACCHNFFAISHKKPWTHVRLNVFSGCGIARLRIYGEPWPDLSHVSCDQLLDLLSLMNGSMCIAASCPTMKQLALTIHLPSATDSQLSTYQRFSRENDQLPICESQNIFKAGNWQEVWAIYRLACPGNISKVELKTGKFPGKFLAFLTIDACSMSAEQEKMVEESFKSETSKCSDPVPWFVLVSSTGLLPCSSHTIQIASHIVRSHIRLRLTLLLPSPSPVEHRLESLMDSLLEHVHIWGHKSTQLLCRL
ncbi:allantoicase isoform X1 [Octopus sinensis]|uniref:Allantoate amidinohydrolase n=1 Tax=Octopus sinensis TaxID=2607531 RepID=A0A6P7T3V6_9MOLL|nr:allantoicase isoform X1 [Octopus sinensis]XP_036364768.1 allantoicase isoform X1 [Octopus sinensis]XP_036364769.1 allantoicase isoform X1 [Octopus sinensis]XP_036364770.1 allantoicase isoform X1 [Octopus sinensis]